MNKQELAEALASQTGLPKSKALEVLTVLFDGETGVIASTLKGGDQVALTGFGTFKSVAQKARTARNPQTGATIEVPARNAPRFSAGKNLKTTVA